MKSVHTSGVKSNNTIDLSLKAVLASKFRGYEGFVHTWYVPDSDTSRCAANYNEEPVMSKCNSIINTHVHACNTR